MADGLLWVMWSNPQELCGKKTGTNEWDVRETGLRQQWENIRQLLHDTKITHLLKKNKLSLRARRVLWNPIDAQGQGSSPLITSGFPMTHLLRWKSILANSPVRSLAKSGWFMRQWLANLTHSSLMGTWMSLNLWRREMNINISPLKMTKTCKTQKEGRLGRLEWSRCKRYT